MAFHALSQGGRGRKYARLSFVTRMLWPWRSHVLEKVWKMDATLFSGTTYVSSSSLKVKFPRLFFISLDQNATMASMAFWDGFRWIWNFKWARALCPQDIIERDSLLSILILVDIPQGSCDLLIWASHKSSVFSIRSFSHKLAKLNPYVSSDDVKGLWMGLVPPRIEVFC